MRLVIALFASLALGSASFSSLSLITSKPGLSIDNAAVGEEHSLSNKVVADWRSAEDDNNIIKVNAAERVVLNVQGGDMTSSNNTSITPNPDSMKILTDLGWTDDEATIALVECNNDVSKASELLERKDEELDRRRAQLAVLVEEGWNDQVAFGALEICEGNATAASELLVKEEESLGRKFNIGLQDMVSNGWSEIVAREALTAQWEYDQRKAQGENVTVADAVLQSIRPTLRKLNQTTSTTEDSINSPSSKDSSAKNTLPSARKEDVVFEVTASNVQKIVLESPVPVLLDVYADWCGPCKQLGPVLESAAVKGGGLFRLAKVNSDQERAVAEALGVQGLPTVFAVSKGKVIDRFVGMLPTEQLQQFLLRAVTGAGARVQAAEVTEKDLQEAEGRLRMMAGLSELTFSRKEELRTGVEAALDLPGAYDNAGSSQSSSSGRGSGSVGGLSVGVQTALRYISNCRQDIQNKKFRSINTLNKAYIERVASCAAASKLLEVAGFERAEGTETLQLTHSNSAVLTLISQKVEEVVNERKFSRMRSAVTASGSSGSTSTAGPSRPVSQLRPAAVDSTASSSSSSMGISAVHQQTAGDTSIAPATDVTDSDNRVAEVASDTVNVVLRFSDPAVHPRTLQIPRHTTLRHTLTKLLSTDTTSSGSVEVSSAAEGDFSRVEVRYPLPRRKLHTASPELDMEIGSLLGAEEGAGTLSLHCSTTSPVASTQTKRRPIGVLARLAARRSRKTTKNEPSGQAHTLFSTGILAERRKKNNEYFGGDSTVVSAGEEEEHEGVTPQQEEDDQLPSEPGQEEDEDDM